MLPSCWALAFCASALLPRLSSAPNVPTPSLDQYRTYCLSQPADPDRGRALFFDEARLGCSKCHTVDGQGRKAGPDLYAIGDKYPRPDLIEAILQPSLTIAVGYTTTVVTDSSGDTYAGVLQAVDEQGLDLMGADGRTVHFARAELQGQSASPVSLMPEGLQSGLTLQEFDDLVEYLSLLRQPESAHQTDRATPSVIPELTKLASLSPCFGQSFTAPPLDGVGSGLTGAAAVPGRTNVWLITHQIGLIWLVEPDGSGSRKSLFRNQVSTTYSKTGPNGLLGITFHPRFAENRKYYLKYQVFESGQIATVIDERQVTADLQHDLEQPGRRLIHIPSLAGDHGGGCLQFGPDGFLYFAMGDSGPHRDPNGHAQNMQLLLGKMLRIDVDHADPGLAYAIPKENPFIGQEGVRPEIWAAGLRNPWRFSFDPKTGALWLADVGQDRVEEVDLIRPGENYGWNVYEGLERFSDVYRKPDANYTAPVMAYRRKYGNSITGGYVYRGRQAPTFEGVYLFGDFTSKRLFGMTLQDGRLATVRQIGSCPQSLVSFACAPDGEIYVVGFEGTIYRMDLSQSSFPGPDR